MIMTNENVATSNNVEERANNVFVALMANKSANVTEAREEIAGVNEEVFYRVKEIMAEQEPGKEYGCSRTDGRFWLV